MRKSLLFAGLMCLAPSASMALNLEELLAEKGLIEKGQAKSAEASPGAAYWNGATQFSFANSFTMNLKTLIQTRYGFNDQDEEVLSGSHNTSSFDVRRARIIVYGDAADGQFSYYLQPDFIGKETRDEFFNRGVADLSTPGNVSLQTAYLTWHATEDVDLRMGQYKTLISRQYNTTDGYDQLPERSIASEFLFLGRQQGLTASTRLMDNRLGVWAGIYNGLSHAYGFDDPNNPVDIGGEGENRSGLDTNMAGLFAIRWSALGEMNAYQEGDYNQTEDLALSFGAAYGYASGNIIGVVNGIQAARIDSHTNLVSVDANMKYQGWSFHGELFTGNDDIDAEGSDSTNPFGWYAQAGYFIVPKEWEVVARYSYATCDNIEDGNATFSSICISGNKRLTANIDEAQEVTVGLNYFFSGQNVKAQLAYSHYREKFLDLEDADSNQIIFQLQFMG